MADVQEEQDPARRPAFRKAQRLAGQAIAQYHMVEEGDRVLVGLSGGRDSLVMAHILDTLRRKAPVRFELVFFSFDPGFPGFDLRPLRDYCRSRGWRHEVDGVPIPDVLKEKEAEGSPCVLCSRLRRGKIHAAADAYDCGKIALGHHLDDLCVSLLMRLFRGQGLSSMAPNVPADHGARRLIRPLCLVTKAQLNEAAAAFDFPPEGRCAYESQLKEHGDRAFLERALGDLEKHFPHIRQAMRQAMGDVRPDHLMDIRFLKL